jgi:hypothetical protein
VRKQPTGKATVADGLSLESGKLLAEILRLQRWAGGTAIDSARLFGLLHGFETALRLEKEAAGISEAEQNEVEDLLTDVGSGKQSVDSLSIKDRLHGAGVDESKAIDVMQLCLLQSRFSEEIAKIADGAAGHFRLLNRKDTAPESQWFGALHCVELVDCSAGERAKLHAVCSPCVPRVGELIRPEGGKLMKVVNVEHLVVTTEDSQGCSQRLLVPHVFLESIETNE